MKTITTHRIAEVLEEAGFDWEMDGADAPEVLIRVAISGITLDHTDKLLDAHLRYHGGHQSQVVHARQRKLFLKWVHEWLTDYVYLREFDIASDTYIYEHIKELVFLEIINRCEGNEEFWKRENEIKLREI